MTLARVNTPLPPKKTHERMSTGTDTHTQTHSKNGKKMIWREGATPMFLDMVQDFGLTCWLPTKSRSRSEICSANRFSHGFGRGRNSLRCSEDGPGFRELLRESLLELGFSSPATGHWGSQKSKTESKTSQNRLFSDYFNSFLTPF